MNTIGNIAGPISIMFDRVKSTRLNHSPYLYPVVLFHNVDNTYDGGLMLMYFVALNVDVGCKVVRTITS